MLDIDKDYLEDIDDAVNWCEELYDKNFAKYFKDMTSLYERIQSTSKPITDSELELILSKLPLQLFAASEEINKLKAGVEVIRLKMKQTKHDVEEASEATSQTKKREEAVYATLVDEMLLKLYGTVIERVEREITFSKELIMSAKKIWTARRDAESSSAHAENVNLPDYSDMADKAYIK